MFGKRAAVIFMILAALFFQTTGWTASQTVRLVPLSSDAHVQFGLKQLRLSLEKKHVAVAEGKEKISAKTPQILVGTAEAFKSLKKYRVALRALSSKPESFLIRKTGKTELAIIGRDDTGVLYGALELADQIDFSKNQTFSFSRIKETNKRPFLALRGVNPFLHVQALLDTNSWYFSDAFWRDYLNRLARTRHNFLDIHAAYDLTKTNMPNIFPFFFTDPVYPQIQIPVGRKQKPVVLSAQMTAKIFARFRKLITMAAKRGIHVGLMNYNTAVRVNGKTLGGDSLVAYTRRCVQHLLKACPELWMFGFRVGESGQSEDFFRKAYLEPILKIRPDLNVYTRTWGANSDKIREMGRTLAGHFFVEPKYNGEQLGLPYQAITSPIEGNLPTSYSYEDYCSPPQPFHIIWQVRANGTHRVFRWGDPDFVRRAVHSFTLGNAAGYTVEPMTAYYPLSDFLRQSGCPHQGFFRWMPQRNWFWYELWGRLGYDPETPDGFFRQEFEQRYGKKAGRFLFEALRWNSKIVPMIFAYHRLGPDHRQMAPELEVGNDRFWIGGQMYPGTLADFFLAPTLDPEHLQNIADYVDAFLDVPQGTPWPVANVHAGGDSPNVPHERNFPTAKFGPNEAADFWLEAAQKSLNFLKRAEHAGARSNPKDLACTAADIRAVAHLGRYYAYKTLGARDLAFFYRTGDLSRLESARTWIEKAIVQWDSLAEITGNHYRPFPEWLRMKTNTFTWREEGQKLARDVIDLDRAFVEVRKMRPFYGNPPRVGWTPVRTAVVGESLNVPIFVYSRDRVVAQLFYRRSGEKGFRSVSFHPTKKAMIEEATIPAEDVAAPGVLDYFVSVETHPPDFPGVQLLPRRWLLNWVRFDRKGARHFFPPEAPQKTFRLFVQPPENRLKIADFSVVIDSLSPRLKRVKIRVKASDPLGVAWAKLYFKGLPSYLPWQHKPMARAGEWLEADFPATPQGALYDLEIGNSVGQAVFYPDFRRRAPYFVVPGWEEK